MDTKEFVIVLEHERRAEMYNHISKVLGFNGYTNESSKTKNGNFLNGAPIICVWVDGENKEFTACVSMSDHEPYSMSYKDFCRWNIGHGCAINRLDHYVSSIYDGPRPELPDEDTITLKILD